MNEKNITDKDLEDLFGFENVLIIDNLVETTGVRKSDKQGFSIDLEFSNFEFNFSLFSSHKTDYFSIIILILEHTVKMAIKQNDAIKIILENGSFIEFKTRPNYSLTLPPIQLSEGGQLEPLSFNQTRLEELFGAIPEINTNGHLTFKISNSNGFSFIFQLDRQSKTCQITLLFHLYQDHVYSATFTGITNVVAVVNDKGRALQINGNIPDSNVFILFDHNFAMSPLTNKVLCR